MAKATFIASVRPASQGVSIYLHKNTPDKKASGSGIEITSLLGAIYEGEVLLDGDEVEVEIRAISRLKTERVSLVAPPDDAEYVRERERIRR